MKTNQLIGVNLGGWLVLEKWMTPTLFKGSDAPDEQSFILEEFAATRIRQHRQQFIGEADIAWLAKKGVTALRIPVGFWLFGDYPPYGGCVDYLDWAIEMAEKYSLSVVIELHRAPGSQDGHDNSLHGDRALWFKDEKYRQQTLDVLEKIAIRYGQKKSVWGIGILNEPKLITPSRFLTTRRFYRQAYERMTPHMRSGMAVIFSDGFLPRLMSGAVLATKSHPAVMDVHLYQFAEPVDGWRTLNGHLRRAYARRLMIWWLQLRQPVIIGEWSAVVSGKKMRRVPQEKQKVFEPRYVATQQVAYRKASGQFYWNYKTEGRGVWNFRSLLEDEVLSVEVAEGARSSARVD